ncbi:hypothetical protein FACS1894187_24420 [Synergistales bacterium]|nr:hypothetical protein FACS1894187_24420 [Synergistales bacterium]
MVDEARSIQQTSDGGYIVAGYSDSNDGDVSGNHGNSDYWIVKLSPDGSGTGPNPNPVDPADPGNSGSGDGGCSALGIGFGVIGASRRGDRPRSPVSWWRN